MNNQPLVSICIPVYNAVKYIEETINNFLNQTYSNIEIIIQDDKSKDGTWELMDQLFGDNEKVFLAQNEHNLGIGPNWNAVYERAKGELVVIANADDIHYPQFIEKAIINLYKYNVDFVNFKYQIFFEKDNEKHFTEENKNLTSKVYDNPFETVFFKNPFHIIFTLFKRKCLEEIKINNHVFLNTQVCDFELLLRYSYSYKLYYDEECMGLYRIHFTNNTSIPLAELKSYYRDVMPHWHFILKKRLGIRYRLSHLIRLSQHVKGFIRRRVPFNSFLIKRYLKYAIK